jgi:hypothetical protein
MTDDQSQVSGQIAHDIAQAAQGRGRVRLSRPLCARDVQLYVACEQLTEGLIYLMVLFSPWAFGTSQPWSVWVMNCAGYLLGAMLAVMGTTQDLGSQCGLGQTGTAWVRPSWGAGSG